MEMLDTWGPGQTPSNIIQHCWIQLSLYECLMAIKLCSTSINILPNHLACNNTVLKRIKRAEFDSVELVSTTRWERDRFLLQGRYLSVSLLCNQPCSVFYRIWFFIFCWLHPLLQDPVLLFCYDSPPCKVTCFQQTENANLITNYAVADKMVDAIAACALDCQQSPFPLRGSRDKRTSERARNLLPRWIVTRVSSCYCSEQLWLSL